MRRTLILVVAVVSVVSGACAGDAELGGPALGGTPAAKIGAWELTNAELADEVERWADNPDFLSSIGVRELGDPGRRTAALTTFALSHRVLSEQARQVANAEGFVPTDDEIAGAVASLATNVSPTFGDFSESFQRRIGTDLVYQQVLQSVLERAAADDGAGPSGVRVPGVEVSSRYGQAVEVDAGLIQVEAPPGPAARSAGG